jgi:hypothetical protein
VPADAGRAAGRGDETREHAHGGGLAGAIGAEEAEDFTGFDREAEVIDGQDAVEILAEVLRLDHGA